MSEKMREEFEQWWEKEHGNRRYCESTWRGWKAALRTHENGEQEREAVGWIIVTKDGKSVTWYDKLFIFDPREGGYAAMPSNADANNPENAPHRWEQVFLTHPSAKAIESAAIMNCAKMCEGMKPSLGRDGWPQPLEAHECRARILALITQDGRTALDAYRKQVFLEAADRFEEYQEYFGENIQDEICRMAEGEGMDK